MHFTAIFLSAWALRQVLAAPTHTEVEIILRVEDQILSHQAVPSTDSVTAYRVNDPSSFYVAGILDDPKKVVIVGTGLSADACAKKIDLPSDDYCGKTFSFAGVDNLHLEACGNGIPMLFRGAAKYGYCSLAPHVILSCSNFLFAPFATCFLEQTE